MLPYGAKLQFRWDLLGYKSQSALCHGCAEVTAWVWLWIRRAKHIKKSIPDFFDRISKSTKRSQVVPSCWLQPLAGLNNLAKYMSLDSPRSLDSHRSRDPGQELEVLEMDCTKFATRLGLKVQARPCPVKHPGEQKKTYGHVRTKLGGSR